MIKKEAVYPFSYNGKSVTVHAFVDPIEKRRYWDTTGKTLLRYPLNYKGTGVEETQTIMPEVVFEQKLEDFSYFQKNCANILYYLPDVEAYAIGYYSELTEDESFSKELSIQLLDKLPM
ncbi:hypothetical protein [Bacillus phage SPO1L3]|nr:hypothetical protein Goe9_c00610 [Bacillus phage vB_BsuM-Goe9]WIT26391.1 hypothetical protein [Bacillus phage SPO1L3]WIT26789.1 hypothetical protein [Bacillus phage SPO1L5]